MNKETFDYKKVLEISGHLGLPVKKLLDMLWALRSEGLDNNELIRKIGLSKNSINQTKELLGNFLAPSSSKTTLNESGKASVQALFSKSYEPEESMWSFLEHYSKYDEVISLLKRNESYRVKPNKELDQYIAMPDIEAKRAILMDFFGDIKEKRILFLGVDFTSLAVSHTSKASQVYVLDIDDGVLNSVAQAASSEKLDIKTTKYDAGKDLPLNLKNSFDVVFIDPPYTISGISLFISRALEALDKNNHSARIYISYGNSDRAKERFLPVYEVLMKSGLMMRWVFDKFNRYNIGAESIGSSSSLFVCDITSKSKPLIKGGFNSDIYTR